MLKDTSFVTSEPFVFLDQTDDVKRKLSIYYKNEFSIIHLLSMTGVKSSFPIEDVYVNMTWTTCARRTSKPSEPLNSYEEIIDKVTHIP